MKLRFGNLSVLEFEKKTGIELSDEDFMWMNLHRTAKASFKDDDQFHIFSLPLMIVAGSNAGEEIVKRLMKYGRQDGYKRSFIVETKESGF
jgi:hypothetical protein